MISQDVLPYFYTVSRVKSIYFDHTGMEPDNGKVEGSNFEGKEEGNRVVEGRGKTRVPRDTERKKGK